ncbi:MAG: class II aldolase/adducin family protein [Proteobacteria bacterium]|nr:class II aldolase/adducin family protein [Pseudomonadota bacterium]MBI3495907.1 class II aldolase/adducin family protein [Pseudomonadota bacterium]
MIGISPGEWQLRTDLAATFRVFARLGFNEQIANHNSVMLPDEPGHFLVNPRGLMFPEIRASDLIVCDLDGGKVRGRREPRPVEMRMHGRIHAKAPRATAVLHVHARWTTALSLIEDGRLELAHYGDLVLLDRMVDGSERSQGKIDDDLGDRIAAALGDKAASMLLHSHGLAVSGPSIADAFDELYCLERQAQYQLMALQLAAKTGKKLRRLDDSLRRNYYGPLRQLFDSDLHLAAWRRILDREEPDYAT